MQAACRVGDQLAAQEMQLSRLVFVQLSWIVHIASTARRSASWYQWKQRAAHLEQSGSAAKPAAVQLLVAAQGQLRQPAKATCAVVHLHAGGSRWWRKRRTSYK